MVQVTGGGVIGVAVIGGAGHRGHRWCKSSVVYVTEVIGGVSHRGSSGVYVTGVIGGTGHRRHRWCIIAVTTFIYLQYFISNVLFTSFLLFIHKKHLTTTKLKYAKKITTRFLCEEYTMYKPYNLAHCQAFQWNRKPRISMLIN